ncbi:anthranilate phosphoribosyltransferase [Sphingorhabdus arenilitoris]|uniref:Anthranilate phosphoribosyltransferase n=1 Tax=Sphingorhabdus arenilitoris TaxID=1490041 RepID=A0ABV8RFS6_9SPHN
MANIFDDILDGKLAAGDISAALIELADKGETAQDISAAAMAMRARMVRVSAPDHAIDVCGTGGDGQHSLNVSTAVAIVVAACEVPVAKHGNRAASSKAGGADTLEALGLDLDRAADTAEATLNDLGIAFLFAQKYHPALGPIAPVRKALGRRTIFNLLGPLCNPAGVTRQLIGVASPDLIETYAEAMTSLGFAKALVVSGQEGLDEISIAGPTQAAWISGSHVEKTVITSEDAGLSPHPLNAIRGGDAAYNAKALRRLLLGLQETEQDRAYRDAVILNAAAALMVAGEAASLRSGAEEAAEAIDKGLANALLDCWVGF